VSSVKQALLTQLAHFDDEAFVALANKGLLRRAQKDLEKTEATIEQDSADTLEMRFGEHRIRFDARGPAHARCSCPASGVCQHILAAAIGLQRLAQSSPRPDADRADPGAVVPIAPETTDTSPLPALTASLLALTRADLERHAGRAGYRWAWQFVQDLDAQEEVRLGGERHLVIEFHRPRLRLRYMGGGPESLIADVETRHLAKYQVAAVLALRRAHGAEIAAPEAATRAKATAALDLGKDHALPDGAPAAELESRQRLRASTQQLLEDCVQLGLSHLSSAIRDRFSTLAVWAQGAQYHRLALLLRRITDHVELLLERAGGADEHRLFDELAMAHALLTALASAEARGSEPAHLLGRARSEYSAGQQLELLGLGASAWRAGSGYVGLTMLFWSPADQRFYSCTDARPETQRGFDPIARYKAPGPWSGLGAPQQASGRAVRLFEAQVNAQGRLSASEGTQAVVQPAPALHQRLSTTDDWAQLAEHVAQARRSLLAEPQPMNDWFVLWPARFGQPKFDAVRQTLLWPLFDATDQPLMAELVFSPHTEHAIRRIEQLSSLAAGTLLVGRVRSSASALIVEPLSLIHPGLDNEVDALHFDAAPDASWTSKWLALMRRGDTRAEPLPLPAVAAPRELVALRHWLRQQAERGLADQAVLRIEPATRMYADQCAAAGLAPLAESLRLPSSVSRLLVTNYLCMQTERLLGDMDDL
jgi:hypothetical protein